MRTRRGATLDAAWRGRGANRLASWLAVAIVATVVAGCGYPERNKELDDLNSSEGYRWSTLAAGELGDTLLIVTASGGGTRATALVLSTLRGLDRLKLASGRSLAEEVDVISSVSGGSVAAGYFALTGVAGFDALERDFVRQDGISALLWNGLNPVGLFELATPSKERSDLLIDYLDEKIFNQATFENLKLVGKRPWLILNATDMVEGAPFAFTQNRFDLICSDLGQLKLSVAVAASAAVPGPMSPVTLVNHSPCKAQETVRWPNPWVTNAAKSNWYDNPVRVRRGRVAQAYALGSMVPPPEGVSFIHLLDGGLADNLGVTEPFRLLSTNEVSPNFFNQISKGQIKRVIFILVNARTAKPSELNGEIATPGIIAMLGATINAPIENVTSGNVERLETLLRERFDAAAAEMPEPLAENFRNVETFFVPVDFDGIKDGECRQSFQSIATSWTLPEKEIDALMVAGPALLKSAPKLLEVVEALGLEGMESLPEPEEACAVMKEARRKAGR